MFTHSALVADSYPPPFKLDGNMETVRSEEYLKMKIAQLV